MNDHPSATHHDSDDLRDVRLSAWLDGELTGDEASAFSTVLTADPALQSQADSFRHTDALVRSWYAALPVSVVPPTVRRRSASEPSTLGQRMRRLLFPGLAAAVALCLLVLGVTTPSTPALAASEVVQRTGQAIAQAQGLRVTYTTTLFQRLPRPDGGEREERRTAKGEIRFGKLSADRLLFRADETWDAVDDEPVLVRQWAQTANGQWLWEKQGDSATAEAILGFFDPAAAIPFGPLAGGNAVGSPVDPRTRQAVEGLAVLLRSFKKDAYLHWLGGAWKLEGGRGTRQEPWTYRLEPTASGRLRTVWVLRVTAQGGATVIDESLIDRIELRESITDTKTRKLLSSFHTVYHLVELRTAAWPESVFEGK